MARVFFSYSHDDETYRDQLEKHLAMLKHQGLIETWHDRRIAAGAPIDDTVAEELESADFILLLVSASFLASQYCYSREMRRAMERHETGTARVVPVIVRPCDWHTAPFGKLRAVPKDGKPITSWPNYDEAYADVAREIRSVVEREAAMQARAGWAPVGEQTSQVRATLPRSGNLRIRKEFTDLDADRFLQDTFEFVERYFRGSLAELEGRNVDISCRFQRVDAKTFVAAIYRHGAMASECSVHLSAGRPLGASILFSFDASARSSAFNESLSVESDDQELYLKPLGVATRQAVSKLSQEGAAEFLWGLLIERLQ